MDPEGEFGGDPVLVVPWSDPSDSTGNRRFIDCETPDLDHLPEAEHFS
jgi:hypothetical protein